MKILPSRFRRGAKSAAGVPSAGRYKLRSIIGRGSAARVFRAYDTFLGREVAIKVFDLDPGGSDLVLQEKELRLLASLNHPGIVSLLDAGVDTSESDRPRAFLVMDMASGDDLRATLASAPPTSDQVASLGRDLTDALRYIHERGIVHRDISPANILLTQYGEDKAWHAKFGDFGIALHTAEPQIGSATSGTAAYVSPEQVRGVDVGTPSDIYSLGLVLLECFTGQLAFPGVPDEVENPRLRSEAVMTAEVPSDWHVILTAMTSRDPADRPTAQQAYEAFCRIHEHRTGRHQIEEALQQDQGQGQGQGQGQPIAP